MSENNLTEEQRRLLTGWMGECWHIPDRENAVNCLKEGRYEVRQLCTKCGKIMSTTDRLYLRNRTFYTWQDLGDLKEKLVEKGLWDKFYWFVRIRYTAMKDSQQAYCSEQDFAKWLLNPIRFVTLVAEFKPWERGE